MKEGTFSVWYPRFEVVSTGVDMLFDADDLDRKAADHSVGDEVWSSESFKEGYTRALSDVRKLIAKAKTI